MGRVGWCQSSIVVLYVDPVSRRSGPLPLPLRPSLPLPCNFRKPGRRECDRVVAKPARARVEATRRRPDGVASPQTSSEGAADVSCFAFSAE